VPPAATGLGECVSESALAELLRCGDPLFAHGVSPKEDVHILIRKYFKLPDRTSRGIIYFRQVSGILRKWA
jgi:hypothetical protein